MNVFVEEVKKKKKLYRTREQGIIAQGSEA